MKDMENKILKGKKDSATYKRIKIKQKEKKPLNSYLPLF
jgi:hypothetical protein